MKELEIRPARRDDAALVLAFIRELAEYERLSHEVETTEAQLGENLFGSNPQAEVVIAEWQGEAVGFALFFHNFSTFRGVRGLYLEDLFVRPVMRGKGIGKALLKFLAGVAVERGCARFEWSKESRSPSNTNRVAHPQVRSARRVVQGIVPATPKPRNADDVLVVRNPKGLGLLPSTRCCSRLPGARPATSLAPRFDGNKHTAATVFEGDRDSRDWNRPAIEFYEAMGARLMQDWRICRLDGAGLEKLAHD